MLLEKRKHYSPFEYQWAHDFFKAQQRLSWRTEEVKMGQDLLDWHDTPEREKAFIKDILLFFTQADSDVASGYSRIFLPYFSQTPEVTGMLMAFGQMEAIHMEAYSLLIETLQLPKDTFSRFLDFKALADKHDYMSGWYEGLRTKDFKEVAYCIAAFSAFGEGLQLFSSFAMLLNFTRVPKGGKGKFGGMSQIVTWSIRDETLHVEGMIKLFQTFVQENIPAEERGELADRIRKICRKMVELEFAFIDMAYADEDEVRDLKKEDLKEYIRFIADRRLAQLSFSAQDGGLSIDPVFGVVYHPLEWLDAMLSVNEHSNFFERVATEYAMDATKGSWDDVWSRIDNK